MDNNGFHVEIEDGHVPHSVIEVEVTQYHKDTYGADGDIRVQTTNGGPSPHNVWLDIKAAKRLRKQLKRAIEFLES